MINKWREKVREGRLVEEIPRKTFVLIISVFNKDYLEDQISVFQKKNNINNIINNNICRYIHTYILYKKLFFKKGFWCLFMKPTYSKFIIYGKTNKPMKNNIP